MKAYIVSTALNKVVRTMGRGVDSSAEISAKRGLKSNLLIAWRFPPLKDLFYRGERIPSLYVYHTTDIEESAPSFHLGLSAGTRLMYFMGYIR